MGGHVSGGASTTRTYLVRTSHATSSSGWDWQFCRCRSSLVICGGSMRGLTAVGTTAGAMWRTLRLRSNDARRAAATSRRKGDEQRRKSRTRDRGWGRSGGEPYVYIQGPRRLQAVTPSPRRSPAAPLARSCSTPRKSRPDTQPRRLHLWASSVFQDARDAAR